MNACSLIVPIIEAHKTYVNEHKSQDSKSNFHQSPSFSIMVFHFWMQLCILVSKKLLGCFLGHVRVASPWLSCLWRSHLCCASPEALGEQLPSASLWSLIFREPTLHDQETALNCRYYHGSLEDFQSFAVVIRLSSLIRTSTYLTISIFTAAHGLPLRSISPFFQGLPLTLLIVFFFPYCTYNKCNFP